MMIGRMHDGAIVVNYVTPGGPAELAGVRSGQRLLAVDDVGVHGMRVVDSVLDILKHRSPDALPR